jgi:RNA polymerase sigma-70 factor (ECF subfamily)
VIDFSGLYRAHARDVHRFALYLSGDPALAEDIVSETFIRLWNARARVDLATVKGYLFAIARNLFLQERRGARRTTGLDEQMADPQPGPDDQLRVRSELGAVLAALQALPEIDRAAVSMRTDEELPYEEIGRILGISAGAAKVKVHRARLKLAEARRTGSSSTARQESRR